MKVGCFALVAPFLPLDQQLELIAAMGVKYADVTDNHAGGLLGDYIFDPSVSLDSNPMDVKRLFAKHGLTISSVAAHAHLLDPVHPARYGTAEIMKALKLAHGLGVKHVITTEHHGHTEWAKKLPYEHRIVTIADKLYEPVRLAEDLGLQLLLEPHGPVTDTIQGIRDIRAALGNPAALGVCLDTGNSWLGGADPVAMAKEFRDIIGHVHWKDLPAEMEAERGLKTGCGFASIPLGTGVIDVAGVFAVLKDANVAHSTLEIYGEENLRASLAYLRQLGADC